MKRGDVVVAAARGLYSGKPRPALIVQGNLLNSDHPSLILALITSELREFPAGRVRVEPGPENGLRVPSDIMVDKLFSVPRESISQIIGVIGTETQQRVDRALAIVLGLA